MAGSDIAKRIVYDELITKVNTIDASRFVLKTLYNSDNSDLEEKIDDIDKKYLILLDLFKKHFNPKITATDSKIPSISGVATTAALQLKIRYPRLVIS